MFDQDSGQLQYRSGLMAMQADEGLSEGEGEEEPLIDREEWYSSSNLLPVQAPQISSVLVSRQKLSEIDDAVAKFKNSSKCDSNRQNIFDPKSIVKAIPARKLPSTMVEHEKVAENAIKA